MVYGLLNILFSFVIFIVLQKIFNSQDEGIFFLLIVIAFHLVFGNWLKKVLDYAKKEYKRDK
ncbi:hypothetical protein QFZ87_000833 [Bacillus sp. SLBN-46]|nr:hypothetical protein [Bacillus sp. SLBN-46]